MSRTRKVDRPEHDAANDVWRVRTAEGVLLGTELGGPPCAYDSAAQAEDVIERRAELSPFLGGQQ